MKIRCPRCQQKFNVSDEWAGKTIRCTGCNKAFTIPKPQDAPLPGNEMLDLESLAKQEARTGGMEIEDLAAAEADLAAVATAEAGGAKIRTCPHCNKAVPEKDPFVELLCSHCWKPIPAIKKGAGFTTGGAVLVGARNIKEESKIGFYEALGSANTYPIGAMGSLLLAAVVAIGSILLPVLVTTAMERATEQSKAGLEFQSEELTGVQKFLTLAFYLQVLFFAGVGVHAFVDVTRTTAIGEEKPPPLVWNPSSWGESIGGYFVLLAYYGVFFLVAVWMSSKDQFAIPQTKEEFNRMLTPGVIALAAIATFIVPMNLIGLSVGKLGQALNPSRVLKSIAGTHVHYVFLFLLVTVYGSLYVALFSAVLNWFYGEVRKMEKAATAGDIASVALGLVFWGLVMSVFFYFVYVLGRLHGLFARTFRKKIEFSS